MHLELVESLSSESFINALLRFWARRGDPKEIYSDNGTNFIGAYKEINSGSGSGIKKNSVQQSNQWESLGISTPQRHPTEEESLNHSFSLAEESWRPSWLISPFHHEK